jgi:hypothetical protein
MTLAIIVGVLTGALIGFRFKVFMVMPAILATTIAAAVVAIAQGETFWVVASAIGLSAAGLQIGYLCGSFAVAQREAPLPVPNAEADRYQPSVGIPVQFSDR